MASNKQGQQDPQGQKQQEQGQAGQKQQGQGQHGQELNQGQNKGQNAGRSPGQQGDQSGQFGQREQSNPGGSDQQGRKEVNPSQQQDGSRSAPQGGGTRRPMDDNAR
ncbi:hypothetical protein J2W49_002604 [Hydrogenophaga palleronii]|uniref:Uncharacterized protein n=1 Tax=Hydrogenophaga palleronii TaxID=65655 RepID=A0ABU1WMX1_9BURK|nr:hypothetical protein [Hydrogenophaga palleronii]MDR7150641.1 hypothetical protein [Hydrogenophaga palleronii]